MTVQHITEEVRQQFPQLGERQILVHIDRVQKEFCAETRILETVAKCSDIYTNVVYQLPSNFQSLIEVLYYDSNGLVAEMKGVDYEISGGNIHFFKTDESLFEGFPDSIAKVYLRYHCKPSNITAISSALSIAEDYAYAIYCGVLEAIYSVVSLPVNAGGQMIQARDWNAVRYFKGKYQEYVRSAKIDRNVRGDEAYRLITSDMAGSYRLPKRQATDVEMEILAPPVVTTNEKILDITAVQAGEVFEGGSVPSGSVAITYNNGYGTVSVSIVGTQIQVISADDEFTEDTFVQTNQTVNYTWVNAGQILVDLPSTDPWGVLTIRISRRYTVVS